MMNTELIEIQTENGKKLYFKELSPGEVLDLILACGSKEASNEAYFNLIETWCGVRQINDELIPFPRNISNIKEIVNKIGNDGIAAISSYFNENEKNISEGIEEIKN